MQQISSNQPRAVSGAQCPMEQQGHVPTGQQGYAPTGQPVQSVPGPGVPIQPLVNQPRVGGDRQNILENCARHHERLGVCK